jgi:hypothetical protein
MSANPSSRGPVGSLAVYDECTRRAWTSATLGLDGVAVVHRSVCRSLLHMRNDLSISSPCITSPPGRNSSACTASEPTLTTGVSGRARGNPRSANRACAATQDTVRPANPVPLVGTSQWESYVTCAGRTVVIAQSPTSLGGIRLSL